MGKVRIKRGIFVGILGILFLLLGIQQVNAEETEQLCYCTCSPIEVTEDVEAQDLAVPEETEDVETQNIASPEEAASQEEEEVIIDYSSANIILNEIYPAPLSGETEFIELYNAGSEIVDLNLWYLMDESEKKYIIRDLELEAWAYIFFDYDTTRIALNNGGDTVYLYDPADNLRHSLVYPGVEKGDSLVNNNGEWEISLSPTAGAENIIEEIVSDDVELQDFVAPETEDSTSEEEDNNVETQNIASPEADNDVIEIPETQEIVPDVETQNVASPEEGESVASQEDEDIIIYENQDILTYKTWADDALIKFAGKIISPAGGWINNRCFIAKENQAIPILCTALAAEFKYGETVDLSGEVSFKNGVFYRFDPDSLSSNLEEINLAGDIMTEDLEEYKIYNYQGLVTDTSEKYHKITLETELAGEFILRWSKVEDWELPLEGDFIKGLVMLDNKDQFWLWEKWKIVISDDSEIIDTESLSENDENSSEEETPELPALVFGIGAIGAVGTGKAAWSYREILKKIIVRK